MGRRTEQSVSPVETLFQTAIGFHQRGELQRAEHLYREILRQAPRHADALHMLGVVACQSGQPRPGAELIEQAVALAPDNADFHNNLGMALNDSDRRDAAAEAFRRAIKLRPRFVEAHCNLANLLREIDDIEGAEKHYRKALRHRADFADALNNLGNLLREAGRADEAVPILRRLVKNHPGHFGGWFNLGLALQQQAEYAKAADALQRVVAHDPAHTGAWEVLGHCQRLLGDLAAAEAAYLQAIEAGRDNVLLWNQLGLVQYAQTRTSAAEASFQRGLETAAAGTPERAVSLNHLGMTAAAAGDRARAQSHFERALEVDPGLGDAYRNLAELGDSLVDFDALEQRIRAALARAPDSVDLNFALGTVLDAGTDTAGAFAAWAQANALRKEHVRFDITAQARYIDAIIETFDADFFARNAHLGDASERPLFVLGMPRSGTTLIEQILASHADVFGAGELTFFPQHVPALPRRLGVSQPFPRCVAGRETDIAGLSSSYLELLSARHADALRVTDKMPYNFLYLGIITLLFPCATVVHCRRDPVATCFSIYRHDLAGSHPYSYAFDDLAAAYHGYERLMAHWQEVLPRPMHEVGYEQLIDDPEAESRALIAACGLAWDPACLEFHRARRPVITASQWQVREPIYTTSRGGWERYAQYLAPLIEALGAAEGSP